MNDALARLRAELEAAAAKDKADALAAQEAKLTARAPLLRVLWCRLLRSKPAADAQPRHSARIPAPTTRARALTRPPSRARRLRSSQTMSASCRSCATARRA